MEVLVDWLFEGTTLDSRLIQGGGTHPTASLASGPITRRSLSDSASSLT